MVVRQVFIALVVWFACPAFGEATRAETAAQTPAEDLAQQLVELNEAAGLSLSPSRRFVSFEIRRANASTNTYSSDWVVLDLERPQAARRVADGGAPA